jgi:hypothetical protein
MQQVLYRSELEHLLHAAILVDIFMVIFAVVNVFL